MVDISGLLIILSWWGLLIMPLILVISFIKRMRTLGGLV